MPDASAQPPESRPRRGFQPRRGKRGKSAPGAVGPRLRKEGEWEEQPTHKKKESEDSKNQDAPQPEQPSRRRFTQRRTRGSVTPSAVGGGGEYATSETTQKTRSAEQIGGQNSGKSTPRQQQRTQGIDQPRRGMRGRRLRGIRRIQQRYQSKSAETKISRTAMAFMITIAAIVDLAQALVGLLHFIPVIGNVAAVLLTTPISIGAWIGFFIWFKVLGVSFVSPRRALYFNGGFLLELIPILKILPGWTLAVTLTILSTKMKIRSAQ